MLNNDPRFASIVDNYTNKVKGFIPDISDKDAELIADHLAYEIEVKKQFVQPGNFRFCRFDAGKKSPEYKDMETEDKRPAIDTVLKGVQGRYMIGFNCNMVLQ